MILDHKQMYYVHLYLVQNGYSVLFGSLINTWCQIKGIILLTMVEIWLWLQRTEIESEYLKFIGKNSERLQNSEKI